MSGTRCETPCSRQARMVGTLVTHDEHDHCDDDDKDDHDQHGGHNGSYEDGHTLGIIDLYQ